MSKLQKCTTQDLRNYFHEEISQVVSAYKFKVPEQVHKYLTLLMTRAAIEPPSWDPTLTELYMESLEADKIRRLFLFKEIGDKALIFSGYFPESVEKKSSIDFYISMGSKGYSQAYYIIDNPLYLEMANTYDDLVKILNEVAEAGKHYSDEEILAIYSDWISTKNPTLERKLNRRGFVTKGVSE